MQSMETISIKQSLLSTISNIDDRDTGLLEKLIAVVKTILQQDGQASAKDEITPYVDSMKVGMKLPADLDMAEAEKDAAFHRLAGAWANDAEAATRKM